MLKIKDNVDLKELEKFGFEKDEQLSDDFETIYSVQAMYQKLCFELGDKKLFLHEVIGSSNTFFFINTIIYDLIKADLVEKVDE